MENNKNLIFINLVLCLTLIFLIIYAVDVTHSKNMLKNTKNKLEKSLEKTEVALNRTEKQISKMDFYAFKARALRKNDPIFNKIVNTVFEKSKKYGFHPDLVLALIKVESNFNPYAMSPAGAYGLMQVNYSVWKNHLKINQRKIFNIEYNIELGLKILKTYYKETGGNLRKALHLYNNGYLYNNRKYVTQVINVYSVYTDNSKGEI